MNGKPLVVSQIYLGRADVVQKVTSPPVPETVQTKEFGVVAALLHIAEKFSLRELIDEKENQSAGFVGKETPLTKSGNTYLRYYLIEAANCVLMRQAQSIRSTNSRSTPRRKNITINAHAP